jgi:hypothetical protein
MDYGSQAENSFQLISFASHHSIIVCYGTKRIVFSFFVLTPNMEFYFFFIAIKTTRQMAQ